MITFRNLLSMLIHLSLIFFLSQIQIKFSLTTKVRSYSMRRRFAQIVQHTPVDAFF